MRKLLEEYASILFTAILYVGVIVGFGMLFKDVLMNH